MEKNSKKAKNCPKVFIVGGLLFGDEGKGTIVEYIAKQSNSKLLIRYNGGC